MRYVHSIGDWETSRFTFLPFHNPYSCYNASIGTISFFFPDHVPGDADNSEAGHNDEEAP